MKLLSDEAYFAAISIKDDCLKEICINFFRWWYNQPGQNTEQGFDQWLEGQTQILPKESIK